MSQTDKSNLKMKNLVDISTMVTQSVDFYSIKDKIIEKMLEVVHPTKACVNLFYENNYEDAYLVCSQTLEYISTIFPMKYKKGVKINFKEYPKYIHEAVEKQEIIYIKDIFKDERAINERELAKQEGYVGRIIFPLIVKYNVVGFMTCFLTNEDKLNDSDIDFIASVASLISLSIDITTRNNSTNLLVCKLRGAISSINEATKKLYFNKNMNEFLDHLSKQACYITKSKESMIIIEKVKNDKKIFSFYSSEGKQQTNIYPIMDKIKEQEEMGFYCNKNEIKFNTTSNIDSYIYHKLNNKDDIIGYIVCANSKNYTKDDLNILSILSKQVYVAMKIFEQNLIEVNHKVLANELEVLNKQQKLIMNESKIKYNDNKALDFYHKPAKVVGGDFYHAIKINDKKTVCIIADVMGHGIVSNYVVAMIKGAFKVLARTYQNSADIMTNLNNMLYDEFDKMGTFTTCLISMIDYEENIITIANAGHYSPIMLKKDGMVKRDLHCEKGIPIGVIRDVKYTNNKFDLQELSLIWMYTDGILEIRNKSKEEYGVERLEQFIQNNYKFNQNLIIENLKMELNNFSDKDNYSDDILVVMLRNE